MDRAELEQLDTAMLSAWSNHDLDAFLDNCSDDIVWNDPAQPEPLKGKKAAAEFFQTWMTAFPDFEATMVNRVVGDDSVAVEVVFGGTNTGPMDMGGNEIPATGKAVKTMGSYFAKVSDGKLTELSTYPDLAGMMMQMGLMG
jgi:steroid delta-isomerase-like uncharacterized protein